MPKYQKLFDNNNTLICHPDIFTKIHFFQLDIITDKLNQNYDIITCFHTLNHIYTILVEENQDHAKMDVVLTNLLDHVNYLFVFNIIHYMVNFKKYIIEFLTNNNYIFTICSEYVYVYKTNLVIDFSK